MHTSVPGEPAGAPLRPDVLELTVVEVVQETEEAVSIVFDVPERSLDTCRYRPGQFLTLRVPSEHTPAARCYSLSSSPHLDDRLVVTVKRTIGGYASNWLCNNARPGLTLASLPPSGRFSPGSLDADLLLIAAGSGITPLMSILTSALLGGSATVYLFFANADRGTVIFGSDLDDMMIEFPDRLFVDHWLESEDGRPTVDALVQRLGAYHRYDAFVCGPGPFMDVATSALELIGTPPGRIHVERFRSLSGDPFVDIDARSDAEATEPAGLEIDRGGERTTLRWPRNRTLLDVLLGQGLNAPYSCREGECSACAVRVVDGEVRMIRNQTLVDADIRLGLTLACQALPVSDHVGIAFDQ